MATDRNQFDSVQDYFDALAENAKNALMELKDCIFKVVPDAQELMNYQIPAYALIAGGKREEQIMIAAYKKHVALYPHPTTMVHFESQLTPYKRGKGSVQFPIDQPIPHQLIISMVAYRYDLLKKTKSMH